VAENDKVYKNTSERVMACQNISEHA
jgi:hypothetical protein